MNDEQNPNDSPQGDPFPRSESPAPLVPAPAGEVPQMPQLWIGYLLAGVTLVGEMIAVGRNPDLMKPAEGQLFAFPPLEMFLPVFVASVYWLVCVYRYHVILNNIPGWKHPYSAAKVVGFYFIPLFNFIWSFIWPNAVADFVNSRLPGNPMKGWVVGLGIIISLICRVVLDGALGIAILFMTCTYISRFLVQALSAPHRQSHPAQ